MQACTEGLMELTVDSLYYGDKQFAHIAYDKMCILCYKNEWNSSLPPPPPPLPLSLCLSLPQMDSLSLFVSLSLSRCHRLRRLCSLTMGRNQTTCRKLTCTTWWPHTISPADAGNRTPTALVRNQSVNHRATWTICITATYPMTTETRFQGVYNMFSATSLMFEEYCW